VCPKWTTSCRAGLALLRSEAVDRLGTELDSELTQFPEHMCRERGQLQTPSLRAQQATTGMTTFGMFSRHDRIVGGHDARLELCPRSNPDDAFIERGMPNLVFQQRRGALPCPRLEHRNGFRGWSPAKNFPTVDKPEEPASPSLRTARWEDLPVEGTGTLSGRLRQRAKTGRATAAYHLERSPGRPQEPGPRS
jgi:hypothetical protein